MKRCLKQVAVMTDDMILVITFIIGILRYTHQYHLARIINGLEAEPGQFPFVISVQLYGDTLCGGTLVNSLWIVTAAHCALQPAGLITIMAGSLHRRTGGKIRQVDLVIKHDDPGVNDIALMKVERPFQFGKYIQPVKLPVYKEDTPVGTKLTVIGWGKDEGGSKTQYLRYVDIQAELDSVCDSQFDFEIYESMICAGIPEGGKGSCEGDSGGPLVQGDVLIGIVSFGSAICATLPMPMGVYTQVAYYVMWIQETISMVMKKYE